MSTPSHAPGSSPITLLRSGTAARLAGLTPSTLRIWEHRYGVVSPPRSPAGQRTYSMADVQRLRLIKRLTLEGHAIGTVAGLSHDELLRLSEGPRESPSAEQRVLVIGRALAQKLEGRLRPPVTLVFDDLDHAEKDVARSGAVDVLVVHVVSLHAPVTERVLALRAELPAAAVVAVYSFGAEAAANTLRAAGVVVRREPVAGKELAQLIVASKSRPVPMPEASGERPAPRLFSDAELVSLAEAPSRVACECPRHLAEIVTLLVGFERYSAECVSQNEADAALHRHLHDVTSAARTMFEQALATVVVDEGLVV
ncbi:MAG: MerR family transcriptional regulator [Candidatus Limnocylindria bacterium]